MYVQESAAEFLFKKQNKLSTTPIMYVQEIGAEFFIYSNKNLSTTLIMYVQESGAEEKHWFSECVSAERTEKTCLTLHHNESVFYCRLCL